MLPAQAEHNLANNDQCDEKKPSSVSDKNHIPMLYDEERSSFSTTP
jgi:hypothetical protein